MFQNILGISICLSTCLCLLLAVPFIPILFIVVFDAASSPLCYEVSLGTGSLPTLEVDLPVLNSTVVDLDGNLYLTFRPQSSYEYKVCVSEGIFTGTPACLEFSHSTVFCLPADEISPYCLPPSLVYKTGSGPMFGFSVFEVTANISAYFFMNTESGKYSTIQLSDATSLEAIWYQVLDCSSQKSLLIALFSLFGLLVVCVVIICSSCCCCYHCPRSKRIHKVNNTGVEYVQLDVDAQDQHLGEVIHPQGLTSESDLESLSVESDEWEDTKAICRIRNHGVEYHLLHTDHGNRQGEEVEVEVHGQHMREVDVQHYTSENDWGKQFTDPDQCEETKNIWPARIILPKSTGLQSMDHSLNGSFPSTLDAVFHSELTLRSDGSTSNFSAIEDTNVDMEPPPFAQLSKTVFEVFSQQEREDPEGGNE